MFKSLIYQKINSISIIIIKIEGKKKFKHILNAIFYAFHL